MGRGWALFDRRLASRDSAEPFEVLLVRLLSECARFFDALLSNEAHFNGNAPRLQRPLVRLHTAQHVVSIASVGAHAGRALLVSPSRCSRSATFLNSRRVAGHAAAG